MTINNFISRSFQENTKNQSTTDVNRNKETIIQFPMENISDRGEKDINEHEHQNGKYHDHAHHHEHEDEHNDKFNHNADHNKTNNSEISGINKSAIEAEHFIDTEHKDSDNAQDDFKDNSTESDNHKHNDNQTNTPDYFAYNVTDYKFMHDNISYD